MKRLIVLLISLFIFAEGHSQEVRQWGIKVGLNSSTLGGDASGNTSTTGVHAGFFFMKKSSETIGLMFEAVYSTQGTQAASGSLKLTYNYLNMPLMLNYYATKEFFLQAGPQFGILLSAVASNGANLKDQLNETDFGIGLGMGAALKDIVLNARYNLGISSTSKQTTGTFPNRVIQISLGFKF